VRLKRGGNEQVGWTALQPSSRRRARAAFARETLALQQLRPAQARHSDRTGTTSRLRTAHEVAQGRRRRERDLKRDRA
jgi:hypothetical protein